MTGVEEEWIEDAFRFNWGDKTPAEIVHEFVCIRGDLAVPSGREALARVIEWKIKDAVDNASAAVDW